MPTVNVNTNNTYVKARCVIDNITLVNNYPNTVVRYSGYFQYYTTAYAYIRNQTTTFSFHTYSYQQAVSFNVSGASDPAWTSNRFTVDIAMGSNRVASHTMGFSASGNGFTFSGQITASSPTIPVGTLSTSLVDIGHDSATFNITYTSPYNYWYVNLYDESGKLLKSNCTNGSNTITGLQPGTNYKFIFKLIGRNGTSVVTDFVSGKTTGASYIGDETGNYISEMNASIGETLHLNVYGYDDNFTNTLFFTIGDEAYYVRNDFILREGKVIIDIPFSDEQIDNIYQLTSNSLSIDGMITINTYDKEALIGTSNLKVTLQVDQEINKPMIHHITYEDISNAVDKTQNNQWIIQDVSKVKVICDASVLNHATIEKYIIQISDSSYTSSENEVLTNTVIKENTGIYVTVVDSRGLQTTVLKDYQRFISYSKPVITEANISRVNDVEEGTILTLKGNFDSLTIDDIKKNMDLTLQFRYRKSDQDTWSEYVEKELTINENGTFTYDSIIGDFDTTSSYYIEVVVHDYFYSITSNPLTLLKGQFELFIGDGYVKINGLQYYNDRLITDVIRDQIYPLGSIIEFGQDVNPNETIGGTWQRFGNGKVTVGCDENDTDFNPIGKAGGEKTHTLLIDEMPAHNHIATRGDVNFWLQDSGYGSINVGSTENANKTHAGKLTNSGGGKPHNNMPPYIVVYRWIRVK